MLLTLIGLKVSACREKALIMTLISLKQIIEGALGTVKRIKTVT